MDITFPDTVVTKGCWIHQDLSIALKLFLNEKSKRHIVSFQANQSPVSSAWLAEVTTSARQDFSRLLTSSFQIDKRSKSANKRGTVFLVQYNGTWANGKWEGEGVGCFSCERELITSGPKDSGLRVQKTHIYHHAANE